MPKFNVTVSFTQSKQKTVSVYARDEDEAQQKAVDVVLKWDDVIDAEAEDCEPA